MTETQKELERLRTLQESLDFYADVAENQLPALADKIDNIKLPEIDTAELAKQGENQEATNSKILEEVQNKLTPLEAVLTEISTGKEDIAAALANKDVSISSTSSFKELANAIKRIENVNIQAVNIDGYELLHPIIPNILDIFHSHYSDIYPHMQGGCVRAFTKINVLDSTSALITPDGIIESPNGYYTLQPAEYGAAYSWYILAYDKEFIAGQKLGIDKFYSLGAYNCNITFEKSSFSSTPISILAFENCTINCNASCFDSCSIHDLLIVNSDILGRNTDEAWFANNALLTITITNENIYRNGHYATAAKTGPYILNYPEAKVIQATNFSLASYGGHVEFVNAPKLEKIIGSRCTDGYAGTVLFLPSLKSSTGDLVATVNIKQVIIPEYSTPNVLFSSIANKNVIDIHSGKNFTANFSFANWKPSYLSDAAKVIEMNKNLRDHMIVNMPDFTNDTPRTITFAQDVRNALETATDEAFAAKNWNVSPARTV
jgi:hypothetical protein